MAIRHALMLAALLAVTGCAQDTPGKPEFKLTTHRDRELIPENVVLMVTNTGKETLCVPILETRLGGNQITIGPDWNGENGNRPPSTFLNGLDVSEGMHVILPGKTIEIFVNLGSEWERFTYMKGSVRAAICHDMFGPTPPAIASKSFSVDL